MWRYYFWNNILNHYGLFHQIIILFHKLFLELFYQLFLCKYFNDHLYWLKPLKSFFFLFVIASVCFFPCSSILFCLFFKCLTKRGICKLACSIVLLWSDGNFSSPVIYQVELFLLTSIWSSRSIQHVCETYCKNRCLQKDSPRSHFWKIYGKCTKFARVIKISQVLVFHFTTPFSGCL